MSELQPTTMKDIAEHFGVSIATVSRALNGSARVSEEKRKLICEYAHEHNFYPNDIAKSLRNSHKQPVKVIGVIIPEFTHYYFEGVSKLNQCGLKAQQPHSPGQRPGY